MTPKEGAAEGIGSSGYSLEALAAYHDRGRQPAIAAIDGDPQCRSVLDSMDRLGSLSKELLEHDASIEIEDSWFDQIIGEVAREARAGRDLPLGDDQGVVMVVTEGALRGLVRDAGDSVDGVLVERVDVAINEPSAEGRERVDVAMTISVLHGKPLPAAAEQVKASVGEAIVRSAPWTMGTIDVTIDSLHSAPESQPGEDA